MKRILIIAMITIFSIGAMAQGRPGKGDRPFRGAHADGERFRFQALNLTEEQELSIEKLRLKMQKESIPLHTELKSLHDAHRLMVIDDKASDSEIEKNLRKQNEIRTDLGLMRVKHLREVRSLLTDEQRVTFDNHYLTKGKRGPRGPHAERPGRRMQRGGPDCPNF